MGFLSFNLKYFQSEVEKLLHCPASEGAVYRVKQLLKLLDDLSDEGYPALNDMLEPRYGASKLRAYLNENGAEPFPMPRKPHSAGVSYGGNFELTEALGELSEKARNSARSDEAFLTELIGFCDFIGYEEDAAYIFLLRDTLLPYIFYRSRNRANIYPWLLGRSALKKLTGAEHADDEIRACIFRALEDGVRNYGDFCKGVLPDIRSAAKKYPAIENSFLPLLGAIEKERILVIESGCSATFPMPLKSMDERVDFRMFTSYPYLFEIYGGRIYTAEYETMRLFETLYSQDVYFRFSDMREGKFFVEKCNDEEVERHALAEVRGMLR